MRHAVIKRAFGILLLSMGAHAADAAPGRTPGAFGVSSDGAATYSIPIWTPPGPRGVQPAISLRHNSHSGNGIAGMGWSLDAASAIVRCGRSIAQDGVREGLSLPTLGTSRFCLDGQRLRLLSGAYGAEGSSYATELESYARISLAGNPGRFTMRSKEGLTYEYGSSANSRVPFFNGAPTYRWLLDAVRDDDGNSYTITYDNADGVAVASTITWAGYTATFNYSNARTDTDSERRGVPGGEIVNRKRLESITIRAGTTIARKYVLGYDISSVTGRSRLRSVRECADDAATECLGATSFDYQAGTWGRGAAHSMPSPLHGKYDFNGDGRDDLLYTANNRLFVAITTPTGFDPGLDTGVSYGAPYRIDEFVVRGRDSILENNGGTIYHSRWNSAGGSFTRTANTLTYPVGSIPPAVDTDGDGLVDLAYLTAPNVYIRRNTTPIGAVDPSFAAPAIAARLDQQGWRRSDNQQWSAQSLISQQTNIGLRHYDVDGDGRHDLYVIAAVGTPGPGNPPSISAFMLRAAGNSFLIPPIAEWQPVNRNVALYLNDDRCTDRLDNGAIVFVSSCDGNTGYTVTLPVTPSHFMDWDGDGRTDFLVANGANYGVYRSTGNGAGALESTSIPAVSGFVMDQDGDGLDDFVTSSDYYTHSASGPTSIYALHVPDLLSTVTDGNGVRYATQYVSIARANYASGTFPAGGPDANQAQVQPPEPAIVVGLVTAMDGIGGEYTRTYSYVGARYDTYRDMPVGFQRINVRDSRTGITTRTSYEQTFPLTGRASRMEVLRENETKLLASVETMNRNRLLESTQYNERYYPWVEQVTQRRYEAEGPEQLVATSQTTINEADIDFQTGNTRLVTTTATSPGTSGAASSSTQTDYFAATSTCLDLPERVTSTQQVAGQPAIARVIEFTPDGSRCRHKTQTVKGANNESQYDVTFTYEYDGFGNVNAVSEAARAPDAQGNYQPLPARESHWTYTGANCGLAGIAPCIFTNALNQATSFEYYPETGLLKQQTDSNQLTTSVQYDAFGRAATVVWPDSTSTNYVYSDCGSNCPGGGEQRMTVVRTEKKGSTTLSESTIHLDRFERPIAAQAKLLGSNYQWQALQYDTLGRAWKVSVPCLANASANCASVWSEVRYDLEGRIRSIHRAGEAGTIRTTSIAYSGLLTTITDPLGHETQRLFDVLGRLRRSTDANSYAQIFSYDSAGSLLNVTEESGRILFEATYKYGLGAFQETARSYAQTASTISRFDGFGQPRRWTDAKGQQFEMTFDALSRPLTRRDNIAGSTQEALTNWIWGAGVAGAKDIGQLSETSLFSSDGTYREIHGYDNLGRTSRRTIQIPGEPAYVYDFEYSPTTGQLQTLRFPQTIGTRFALEYGYDSGILSRVTDANTGAAYWALDALNPFGQTIEQLGGSVVRKRTFDAVTGSLEKLEAGPGSNPTLLQNASVLYDEVGNVQQRANHLGSLPASLVEDFTNHIDPLYRFKSGTVSVNGAPAATLTIQEYDSLGNIKTKRDTSGLDSPLDYAITWSGYNTPLRIESSTTREKVSFAYGPDRQRWRMVFEDLASARTETTLYAGLMQKVVIDSGGIQSTEYRYTIPAAGGPIAIHRRTASARDMRYLLTDHLGSLDTVLDAAGNSLLRQSYSPYGLPRDPSAWGGAPVSGSEGFTRQGYTFQTVLGRLGMNHMNGRVQDALTGQFLSPDPFVTDPTNTQNWNRYTYVYNNPLTFIDPSGFQAQPPPDGAPPGSPYPGDPIDPRCITGTGRVLSAAACSYVVGQYGLGSSIADSVRANIAAQYAGLLGENAGGGTVSSYTPLFRDNFAGRSLQNIDYSLGWLTQAAWDGPVRGLFSNREPSGRELMDAKMGVVLAAVPIAKLSGGASAGIRLGPAGTGAGQLTANACGMACGQRLLAYEGISVFQSNLTRGFYRGLEPEQLAANLNRFSPGYRGFYTYPTKAELEGLARNGPFIARLGGNPGHFVVVESIANGTVKIFDPAGAILRTQPFDADFVYSVTGLVFK